MKTVKKQNILIQGLGWYFLEQPWLILKAWRNLLKFNLNYFSIPLLLRTFFSPWRRYRLFCPKGFNLKTYLEVHFSNLISRSLGAILRFFLIIIGVLAEILIIFGGVIIFVLWFLLPLILIMGLIFGLELVFSSQPLL